MKRHWLFFIAFFHLFFVHSTVLAAESKTSGEPSVYETIQKGEKDVSTPSDNIKDSHSSNLLSMIFKLIFSFALVIGLLILILRFLAKKNKLMQTNGLVLSLGSHPLGNNKSLQVLLIGQTIYIVGVGESISLLRSISHGEEYKHLLESFENQGEAQTLSWLKPESTRDWTTIFNKQLKKIRRVHEED